jgi:hypothetical protein
MARWRAEAAIPGSYYGARYKKRSDVDTDFSTGRVEKSTGTIIRYMQTHANIW